MNKLPLFPNYDITENFSIERVNEARSFIKNFIANEIPETDNFLVGFSAGKDSTILLQLMLEALDELGEFGEQAKKRMIVTMIILQAETIDQNNWMYYNQDLLKKAGLNVWTGYTIPEEMYGTEVLGVGRVSMMLRAHVCNQMKETPIAQASKLANWNFTGSRAQESARRAREPRVGSYTTKVKSTVIRGIQPLLTEDVWGYLKQIGTTKWGMTYEALKDQYEKSEKVRDGCWCCCFRKDGTGLSPAQQQILFHMNSIRKYTNFLEIPETSVPSLPRPLVEVPNFQEQWKTAQHPATAGSLRPVEACIKALRWVRVVEKKYNEKILCDEENELIRILQEMRSRYHMRQIRRWMFNVDYWNGRELVKMPEWVIETYRKYTPPKMILNRSNGDWFGRHAIEWQRKDLYNTFWNWDWTQHPREREEKWNKFFEEVKQTGYFDNMWIEPVKGLFANGDPAKINKDDLELEMEARK